jgi:SH3-like domain-containing protein
MNKQAITFKTVVALQIIFALFFMLEAAQAAEYASIKKDGINIRSGPSTENEVLWEVFQGYPVEILKREGDWVYIRDFEDDKGWIYGPLLSDEKTMIVTVDTANMRSGPSTDDKIIATVKKGVVFKPIEQKGKWIKVRYKNEITGWMYDTLLFPDHL